MSELVRNIMELEDFYSQGYESLALGKVETHYQPRHLYSNNNNVVEAIHVKYNNTIYITNKWELDPRLKKEEGIVQTKIPFPEYVNEWKNYNEFKQ